MKLPDLNKEFLTIKEVADRWTDKLEQSISEERVISHGQDGSLKLMIRKNGIYVHILPTDISALPEKSSRPTNPNFAHRIIGSSEKDLMANISDVVEFEQEHFSGDKRHIGSQGKQEKRQVIIKKYLDQTPLSHIRKLEKKDIWTELANMPNADDLFRPVGGDAIGKCFKKCREAGIDFPILNPGKRLKVQK